MIISLLALYSCFDFHQVLACWLGRLLEHPNLNLANKLVHKLVNADVDEDNIS